MNKKRNKYVNEIIGLRSAGDRDGVSAVMWGE